MLKIVTIPSTILNSPTKKVEKFDQSLLKLVKEMEQTLVKQTDPQGVGLAAPQVAVNLSIFIIKPTIKAKIEIFINPRILNIQKEMTGVGVEALPTARSGTFERAMAGGKPKQDPSSSIKRKKAKLEGCLSIPKIWGSVRRAEKILLEYQDRLGKIHEKWFSGFKAMIIQHEVDHLKGVLFTQRALEQNTQLYEEKEGKLKKLKY